LKNQNLFYKFIHSDFNFIETHPISTYFTTPYESILLFEGIETNRIRFSISAYSTKTKQAEDSSKKISLSTINLLASNLYLSVFVQAYIGQEDWFLLKAQEIDL